jgi:hypothetical protein
MVQSEKIEERKTEERSDTGYMDMGRSEPEFS